MKEVIVPLGGKPKKAEDTEKSFWDKLSDTFSSFGGSFSRDTPKPQGVSKQVQVHLYDEWEETFKQAQERQELADMEAEFAVPEPYMPSDPTVELSQPTPLQPGGFDLPVSADTAPPAAIQETTDTEAQDTGNGLMSRTTTSDTGQTTKPFNAGLKPLDSNVVFSDPQMSLIVALEGFKKDPYSLNSSRNLQPINHQSGLTIANGLDVGQHTAQTLRDRGFSESIIEKFGTWIGLNPDTIEDPDYNVAAGDLTLTDIQEIVGTTPDGLYGSATERSILTYLADNNQPRPSNRIKDKVTGKWRDMTPTEWQARLMKGVRRVRGHAAMADTFAEAKANGTLPSYSLAELEEMSVKSWQTLGLDAARRAYGEDFDILSEDVQAVLASEAYVRGSPTERTMRSARAGNSAAEVAAVTIEHNGRRGNLQGWLDNNSFSDEKSMSDQGLQIMTNRLMDSLGLEGNRLTVDSIIGPGSRRTIDQLLADQGKIEQGQSINNATRKKLIEELYYETVMLPPAATEE